MKKLSAILVMVLVLTMTVITVSAADDIGYKLSPSKATVEAGETFTIEVSYTPTTLGLFSADVLIGYDTTLVEFVTATSALTVAGQPYTVKNAYPSAGYLTLSHGTDWGCAYENGKLSTVTFKALADVSGTANFSIDLPAEGGILGNDFETHGLISKEGTSITIGSEPNPDPVFTVDKAVDGNAVKVTVANSNLVAAGKIYVATFDGDVLVDCQVQDITDDTLTFSGLEGELSTAKIFVWDNNNVPIEYATTPAQ